MVTVMLVYLPDADTTACRVSLFSEVFACLLFNIAKLHAALEKSLPRVKPPTICQIQYLLPLMMVLIGSLDDF